MNDLICITIESGELSFIYNDRLYKYNIPDSFSSSKSIYGYKIPFILNGKLVKTNSLKEFYILKYLVDKYGVSNIIYEDKINISKLNLNRKEIQPDFYIKSLSKYIEFHNSFDDGKYDLYIKVARDLKLNIEWWTDKEYYDRVNNKFIPSSIVVSPGFIYNFDTNSYIVGKLNKFISKIELIELLFDINEVELLPNLIKETKYKINDINFLKKIYYKLGGKLSSNSNDALNYIIDNGFDKQYSIDEFRQFYKKVKLSKSDIVAIKFLSKFGIDIKIKRKARTNS